MTPATPPTRASDGDFIPAGSIPRAPKANGHHPHPPISGDVQPAAARPAEPALRKPKVRIDTLDGLRGLAALGVVVSHSNLFISGGVMTSAEAAANAHGPILDRVYAHLAFFNGAAPYVFLALGAYLITSILLRQRDKPNALRDFYIRRALRIWPLYFAVVFGTVFLLPRIFDERLLIFEGTGGADWMYFAFLSNLSLCLEGGYQHKTLDILWSIGLEEQFLLFWPAMVLFASRRTLVYACVTMFVAALACRIYLIAAGYSTVTLYVFTLARLDILAAGALVAIAATDPDRLKPYRTLALVMALATLPMIWTTLYVERVTGLSFQPFNNRSAGPISRTIVDSLAALGCAAAVVVAITAAKGDSAYRLFTGRPLRILGTYAYGLMLFHFPVIWGIRSLVYAPDASGDWLQPFVFPRIAGSMVPAQISFTLIVLAVTIAFSYVSFHLYERHFLKLKDLFGGTPLPKDIVPR